MRGMRRTTLPALLLFALPLAADGNDAATRYHEAYVLEVIEGEIAEAAKAYLVLQRDGDAPEKIRRQAAFRFAVCTALLGRADEARARLAALAETEDLDSKLRAQIEEYRRALEGVAAGSALQERLDDLVFKLGRATSRKPSFVPSAYRDFEVLGDRVRPFLHGLLEHSDKTVRSHAFRLLLRMDEPGMAKHWSRDFYPQSNYDLKDYLQRRPSELAVFEEFILDGDPAAVLVVKRLASYRIGWSAPALRVVAEQYPGPAAEAAVDNVADPDVGALVDEWLRLDGAVAGSVARSYLERLERLEYDKSARRLLDPRRFPIVVSKTRRGPKGLRAYADAMPTVLVLDGLAMRMERDPVHSRGSVVVLADSLDERELEPREQARYRELLVDWIGGARAGMAPVPLGKHLRAAGAGEIVIQELLAGPLRNHAAALADYVDLTRPADFERFGMLLRAAGPGDRASLIGIFRKSTARDVTPGVAEAIVRHAPSWLALSPGEAPLLAQRIAKAAYGRDSARVEACLVRCIEQALAFHGVARRGVLGAWFSPSVRFGIPDSAIREFQARLVLPHRDRVLNELGGHDRAWFVRLLAFHWKQNRELFREHAPGIVQTMLDNVEHIRDGDLIAMMADDPETFPPEQWYHRAKVDYRGSTRMAEAAAAALSKDPEQAHPRLVEAVLPHRPGLLGDLFREARAGTVARLASLANPERVDAASTRTALAKLLAQEGPDLDALGHLAAVLAAIEADESLVPVAARLLRAEQARHKKLGIELAQSLAQPELREDLIALLDSPDANVRNGAKDALEAIAEWQRFREEVKEDG